MEKLTLTTSETTPNILDYRIRRLTIDVDVPYIKVDLVSDTSKGFSWNYAPSEDVSVADVLQAISFINQGKFMVLQDKSLQRFILEKISTLGVKVGTVSGTMD